MRGWSGRLGADGMVEGGLNLGGFGGGFGGGMMLGNGGAGGPAQAEQARVIMSMKRKLDESAAEKGRMKRGLEASKHELQQVHDTLEKERERMTAHIKRQHDIIQQVRTELELFKSGAESKQRAKSARSTISRWTR